MYWKISTTLRGFIWIDSFWLHLIGLLGARHYWNHPSKRVSDCSHPCPLEAQFSCSPELRGNQGVCEGGQSSCFSEFTKTWQSCNLFNLWIQTKTPVYSWTSISAPLPCVLQVLSSERIPIHAASILTIRRETELPLHRIYLIDQQDH